MTSSNLDTEHGLIHMTDTGLQNGNPALLVIHGNSSCSKIFRHIIESPTIASTYRVLAFDLPGHGASSDAPDPEKSYWMRGYADLAVHILQHVKISRVVVLGWSLGGHIGIEMIPLLSPLASSIRLQGLMMTGTPPALGNQQVAQAFKVGASGIGMAGQRDWSKVDLNLVFSKSVPEGREDLIEPWMVENARRTDGRAREIMSNRFTGGEGVDQRNVVETTEILLAVVNGGDEPTVNLDYIDDIKFKHLWKGKCIRLEGLRHSPFWENPPDFEKLLVEFLEDCCTKAHS